MQSELLMILHENMLSCVNGIVYIRNMERNQERNFSRMTSLVFMGDNIYHRNVDLISNLCKLTLNMLEQRTMLRRIRTLPNIYNGVFLRK